MWYPFSRLKKAEVHSLEVEKVRVMSLFQSILFATLALSASFFILRYFAWWVDPKHIPHNYLLDSPLFAIVTNTIIFSILTFVVFFSALLRFGSWLAVWSASKPKFIPAAKKQKVALLTCFVPGKEPLDLLKKTLTAILAVNYPHDSWVLDEGNDPEVKSLCKKLGVKHFSRAGIEKYNQESGKFRAKTKAGNHNAWLDMFEDNYEIVGQIDMDNVPKPNFFDKTLGYFQDPNVGLVVIPQAYSNLDNWIARGAAEQAYFFHGPMQMGYFGQDMPFLIGTSHIYRTSAMKDIGGYAPTIVEDHLTGMLFYANKWKGVFVPEIVAEGEGPTNWVDYINQQMRWSYGLFEILFKHTPRLIYKLKFRQAVNYLLAQLYYFSGLAVFFGIVLTSLYLIFGVNAASIKLLEWLRYSLPAFISSYLVQLYLHRFQLNRKKEPLFGFVGIFLNLAANLVYTIAFFNFILGKKLRYVVTQKGSCAQKQNVSIRTFLPHISVALICISGFILSFLNGHAAIQLRLWAIFNLITFLGVIFSNNFYSLFRKIRDSRLLFSLFRLGLNLSFASLIIAFVSVGYVQQHLIVQAFFKSNQNLPQIENTFIPLAGKVGIPDQGSYLGISLNGLSSYNDLITQKTNLHTKISIVGYFQPWQDGKNKFNSDNAQMISDFGAIPMITWEPWQPVVNFNKKKDEVNQPEFRMAKIANGQYDEYIRSYAQDVKLYRKPVVIRFAHEMNGNWYPWGSTLNTPQEYIAAHKHVHDIFDEVGAKNVTWVWAPNEIYYEKNTPYAADINAFYPGDSYVDWVGLSSFNWGKTTPDSNWRDPQEMFGSTVTQLEKYNKPILIAETASVDSIYQNQTKAEWITKLAQYVKQNPQIKGVIWFSALDENIDWRIDSTNQGKDSFTDSFSDGYFK